MAIKKKKNYNEILYELQKQAVLNKTGTSDADLRKQAAKQDFAQEKRYAPITKNNVVSNTYAKTSTKKATTTTKKNDNRTWFSGGAFSDGEWNALDLTKTILGTTGDLTLGAAKGLLNLGEGLGDAIAYGGAAIADAFGADDYADKVRKQASKGMFNEMLAPAENWLDKYSVLGEKSDDVASGLGYIGGIAATGGLAAGAGLGTVGTTAVTTGLTGVSGFGSGTGEAYQGGATDGEAHLYGLISGVAEAGTELIFGGLGKAVNAVGFSKGLSSADDMLAKKISSKISNQLAKNLTEYTIKAGAEGTEEVMAGLIQGIGKKITYMSEEELATIMADEQLLDQFIIGAVTSSIAQAPGLVKTTSAGQDFIQTENDTQKNISKQIQDLESQLDTSMNANQQQEVLNQINTLKEQYDTETQNINKQKAEQEQAERELRRTNFTYDTTKITDEVEKSVYDSASKYFNNTARSHEFVERVAKISKDKGTRYSFINNEELKANGLNVEGKQVNGLVRTEQDGKPTILINIDSPKALNTIVGHETTHLLEGTQEYQELQKTIFEYAKTKGDLDTVRNNLTELYKDIENADIDSELTAELVGDYLFTDSKFIDSLAVEKPTLFQKIKELIDDLVVRFRGTKEEKQLRQVQKAFRNAYSVSDSNNIDTKYAISENVETMTEDDAIDTMKNLSTIEETRELNRSESDLRQEIINKYLLKSDKFSSYLREYLNERHSKDNLETEGTKNKVDIKKYDTKQSDIQGLENYREGDIEDAIFQDIESKLVQYGYGDEDIEIDSIYLHGSRKRGTAKTDSDLDVVLFYTGEADDVGLFNDLNANRLNIDGVEVDVNPINLADESAESYIARSEAYDKEILSKQDTKYSVTDNQGRTLTKEQQEYFKDSKVRDDKGNLLTMYHGTPYGGFTEFKDYHMGSEDGGGYLGDGYYFTNNKEYASEYAWVDEWEATTEPGEYGNSEIKEVYLDVKNPYIVPDGLEYDQAMLDDIFGVSSSYELTRELKKQGYDGIIYKNGKEVVVFNSNQIKNIDNTNPTTDADIRYSLTPEYGMQHRPSTDYGDASNFEENMPDVFEHPEWYMFGGDDWYKKSYKESLNALRKVRNNPDGEITIYRATVGDTFNEGDWVSPSKTYAEWHNYSNLDGKGKVIELKVKAKDIRFAGDDLNEFGYFPNGVDEYSLSKFNEQRAEVKGNYNVYGEDVKLQVEEAIAPLQEKIETLTEHLDTVVNGTEQQIAPIEQVSTQPTKAELDNLMALQETGGTEYANEFFRLRDKYGQPKLYKGINEYKKSPSNYGMVEEGKLLTKSDLDEFYNQSSEVFKTITDEDAPMPMEDTTPDYDYEKPKVESPLKDRNIEEVGNRKVKAYQYEHPEVRPYFQEAALGMLYDLNNSTKGERIYNDEVYYNTNGEEGWMGIKRNTTDDIADLLDNFNYSYADIEKGLNAIIEDNGAENIAVAKKIEFALDDRLRNGYTAVDGLKMPANQEYIDLLRGKEFTEYYNSIPGEDIAPIETTLEENSVIAPETKNVAENVLKTSHEEIVTKPETTKETTNEVKKSTNPIKPTTKGSTRNTLSYLFVNRNEAIDRFAKETGNNNIKFLADHVNNVSGEISTNINKAQIDNNGRVIGKSIVDIFNQARDAKLTEAFEDYLFHLSNKARHKQGKGSLVPLTESKALIIEYEKAYPEMKKWAREVNKYNKNNLYKQVEADLYSKEFADDLVKKYEFYVPFFADVLKTYVPSKTNGIKTRGTVRLAEGGANRNLLSFEEAMIRQTQSAITAIRKNQLYQEIVESSPQTPLGTEADANGLYVDENGYYLTAKVNGENVSAYISEDLYKGLENKLGQEIRNIEQKLSGITKPLQFLGNIRRNILTTWSPSFIITNPAKDIQDAPLNSKYAKDWAINYPIAFKELATGKGEHIQEFLNMYGQAGIMGDYVIDSGISDATKIAKTKKKLAGITRLNEMLELAPRYAEYLASLKNGASQMEALYNAREVTTNFGRGGVITKALNRNGFTFLNASVQGFNKLYRNFSGENGAKGVVNASLKAIMFGVVPALFNALSYDDDEDYEALPDYIKDNYYLYKTDDGEFIRIPKGRMMSVFGSAARRALEATKGEEDAFEGYLTNAYSQVGIQNPLESNIFAPLIQAYGSKNGKTWYGTDLVPTRLQDVPAAEQYDESTDKFSIWLGETFGISPYKVNYVFDQYSGGIGDLLLPTITEEANSDGSFLAPIKDKFTANSTMDNKYASEFYTKRDKLQVNANSMYATEQDKLMSMYMDEVSWDMSSLYKEKREVQNSDLSKAEKYEKVQEIQQQINDLAKEALETYDTGTYTDNYVSIGNYEFYKGTDYNGNEEWKTVYDYKVEELEKLGMTSEEKNEYFALKQEFDALNNEYYDTKDNLESTYGKHSDEFEDESDELYMNKKNTIIDTIMASNLTDDAKAYLYKEYYNSSDIDTITMSGIAVDYFLDYQKNDFKADYNSKGKAIPNSRKNKVIDYVNQFDLSIPEKAIIIKSTNTFKFNDYNDAIVEYVSKLDIGYEDKVYILEELDMTIDEQGYAHWE